MAKQRKRLKEEWSPQRTWFMGIASALMIALLTAIGSFLYSKWQGSPLSERERMIVYKLIDDIRRHPVVFYAVYQGPHEFITSRWRRCNETSPFFESALTPATIFTLAYGMGMFHDGFRLFDEKCGTASGVIKGLDQFKDTADGIVARGSIDTGPEKQPVGVDMDTHHLLVYTMQPDALPPAIVSYANDLDVPSSIRERLAALRTTGSPVSLRKASQTSTDFVVLSTDLTVADRPVELDTPLYFHSAQLSLFEYVGRCLRLAESIQEWADRSSIDLGDDALGTYEKSYRAKR